MTDIKTKYILDVVDAMRNDKAVRRQIMETYNRVAQAALDASNKTIASLKSVIRVQKDSITGLKSMASQYKSTIASQAQTISGLKSKISDLNSTIEMQAGAMKHMASGTNTAKDATKKLKDEANKTKSAFHSLLQKMISFGTRGRKEAKETSLTWRLLRSSILSIRNALTGGWWSRFGSVAAGFTVAYRAINLMETGLRKFRDILGEAIKETGELASLQAKLAFWHQMHTKEAMSFGDAYKAAAANVRVLYTESFRSLSTLGELATGMDELAQSVGGVPAELVPQMVSVIDFTKLVAQTTGSTTRQIRQELQALTQGQVRTTDILIRSMLKVHVLTDQDVRDLKRMTNQAEILKKVFVAIHEKWIVMANEIIKSDPTRAMEVWEKTARKVFIDATLAASQLKGVKNIFADIFKKRIDSMFAEFSPQDWTRLISFMNALADILNHVLGLFPFLVKSLGYVTIATQNLNPEIKKFVGWIKDLFILSIIVKLFEKFVSILWIVIQPLATIVLLLSKMLWKIAAIASPVIILGGLLAGTILLAESAWDIFKRSLPMTSWPERMKEFLQNTLPGLRALTQNVVGEVKMFFKNLGFMMEEKWGVNPVKAMGDWITGLEEEAKGLGETGKQIGLAAGEVFDELVRTMADKMGKHVEDVKTQIKGWGLKEFIEKQFDLKDVSLEKISKSITNFLKNLTDVAGTDVEALLKKMWGKGGTGLDFGDLQADEAQRVYDIREQMMDAANAVDVYRTAWQQYQTGNYTEKEINDYVRWNEQLRRIRKQAQRLPDAIDKDKWIKTQMELYAAKEKLSTVMDEFFNKTEFMARGLSESLFDTFKTGFFDAMVGEFKGLKEYLRNFARSMLDVMAQMYAKMLVMKMIGNTPGKIGGWFGTIGSAVKGFFTKGAVKHQGGTVGFGESQKRWIPSHLMAMAPRLHTGLRSGEFPAILEKGETVLPKGMAPSQAGPSTVIIQAMDAPSFAEFMSRNSAALVGPMNTLFTTQRSVRSTMKKVW